MTGTPVPPLEQSIEIAAPPATVWALVSDVRRMAEWSPQVTSVRLKSDVPGTGVRFTNRNRAGELAWITHGELVRFEPDRELAFRIEENWVVWSFSLSPAGEGTRLVQRRETPDGISPHSLRLTETYLGGQEAFTDTMRAGMAETLARIKAAAEA